jgi:hypothetical protein
MVHQSTILGIYKPQALAEDRIRSTFIRSITDPVSHTFCIGRGEDLQKQAECPFRFALLTEREWDVSDYLTACSVRVRSATDLVSLRIVFRCRGIVKKKKKCKEYFDVLLIVHLSIFILVINRLDAQNFVLR